MQSKELGWTAPDQVIAKGREDDSKSQGQNDMRPRMRGAEEHRSWRDAWGGPRGDGAHGGFFIALFNAILMLDHVDNYGD